jgi:ABC-type lipoprotein release transport system permease subunit
MPSKVGATRVLVQISLRNLFASKVKTAIVGGIIVLGSVLVVFGSSMVDSLEAGMTRSIQGSLAGHLQLYRKDSQDSLALYGNNTSEANLEPIEDFAAVKAVVSAVPGVKAVVPMGIDQAFVSSGNLFDIALEKLRADERGRLAGETSLELAARLRARKAHVRRMISLLHEELGKARAILEVPEKERAERAQRWANLERADSDAFWEGYERDPLSGLEFLENNISPLSVDGGFTFIRYVGTDLDAFGRAFDRMRIVEGTAVPKGQRGILVGKFYAEEYLKVRTARRLDKMRDAIARGRKIARDEELKRWVEENKSQTRDILLQLDPAQAELAGERLRRAVGSGERDLQKLLVALLDTSDANFQARYRIFYDQLAPLVQLYLFKPGDTITIKAASKSGYINSVNVKVYGLVAFQGMEKSNLASINCLMDLHSFRDLYGYVTADKAEEIRELKAKAGLHDLSREQAEDEMFGGSAPAPVPVRARSTRIEDRPIAAERKGGDDDVFRRVYSQEETDRGVALNAAVILDDPRKLRQAQAVVQSAVDRAGLPLKVVDWKVAAGNIGQMMDGIRIALYGGAFILFAVALVILNNAMVMATLQRVKEIGTLRAIGAQRRFVWAMILVESMVVSLFFGALGAAIGAGLVWLVRAVGGIPTSNDQLQFLFSGPTLMPRLGRVSLVVSLVVVLVVSILSGFYPAFLAMRITPVEAMQSEE